MPAADEIPISGLPGATAVNLSDILPIVQSGVTKKASFTLVRDLIGAVSPANTLFVMSNGSGSGDGSLQKPFALPSQAGAAAHAAGASQTNQYLVKSSAGNYTQNADLPLYPGVIYEFDPGVRLDMGANYVTAIGWDGVAGAVAGLVGFKPVVFAGVNVSIPSDGVMSWMIESNNWGAASDTINVISNNTTTNSIMNAVNCDSFGFISIQGFDETYYNCRIQNVFSVSDTGWQQKSIIIDGGTTANQFAIAPNNTSVIRTEIKSGFVNEFFADSNAPGAIASLFCTLGQIGDFTPSTTGGGVEPVLIQQQWCGIETPDGELLDKNVSFWIDLDAASNARFNAKFFNGISLVQKRWGTQELFVPIFPINVNENPISYGPAGSVPLICGVLNNTALRTIVLTGQIPFDGAVKVVDILIEGFAVGMSSVGMTVDCATSWAALGDVSDINQNSGSIVISPVPEETLTRFSVFGLFNTATPRAVTIGDLIGIYMTTATAAKTFYVTGMVILYQ